MEIGNPASVMVKSPPRLVLELLRVQGFKLALGGVCGKSAEASSGQVKKPLQIRSNSFAFLTFQPRTSLHIQASYIRTCHTSRDRFTRHKITSSDVETALSCTS
jgi:hypothetical protein